MRKIAVIIIWKSTWALYTPVIVAYKGNKTYNQRHAKSNYLNACFTPFQISFVMNNGQVNAKYERKTKYKAR